MVDAAVSADVGVIACNLSKRFGDAVAVRDASFTLPARGVCGLLGPNGAGKTTTIRMISGVLAPDSGELVVAGASAERDPQLLRSRVGYLPESAPLYPELTVREYLEFRAGIAGLPRASARKAIERAMERCDVARFSTRLCGLLSKGMQQRVGVAATLLADPRIVILDEPSVGLDPAQTLAFRDLVRELGATRLVILSSHLLSEVESVCTELAVIAGGQVVAHESIDHFRARATAGARLFAEVDGPVSDVAELRGMCADLSERALDDGWYRIEFASGGEDPRPALAAKLAARGVRIRALGAANASLESVFVELVKRSASEGVS